VLPSSFSLIEKLEDEKDDHEANEANRLHLPSLEESNAITAAIIVPTPAGRAIRI
jgi:hypothetical protein